jgi:Protein of unknown function (DUF1573)
MRLFLGFMVLLPVLSPVAARADGGDWLKSAFPERSFDFGNVARGSQLRHAFPIVNRTGSDIRIANWKTKCGCTNVTVGSRVIPPGTQTTVEATIDTTKFQGEKASGLILVVDQPVYREVDLNVTCFIRGDISLAPGQLDFGTVRRSEKSPSVSLTLTYTGGRPGWQIAEMKTQSAKIKAEARSLNRTSDGLTQWVITATLQPGDLNGLFKDEVTLITNDSPPQTVPISVVARVQGAVTVLPSVLNFGPVRVGQSLTKVVHVRSTSPFTITKLSSDRTELELEDRQPTAALDHEVRITIQSPVATGPFFGIVKIESDVKDEPPAQIKTFATTVSGS